MARTARQPALNAKMYRHFAAATLLLTGAVALIASDQNDEAVAAEDSSAQGDEVALAIRKDNDARVAAKKKGRSFDRFGIDKNFYETNRVNYDVYAGASQSQMKPTSLDVIRRLRAKGPPPGMTYEQWLEHLAEQEAMIMAAQHSDGAYAGGAGSVETMIERSRERSGASGSAFE